MESIRKYSPIILFWIGFFCVTQGANAQTKDELINEIIMSSGFKEKVSLIVEDKIKRNSFFMKIEADSVTNYTQQETRLKKYLSENFDEAELKELLAFYQSPLGKKVVAFENETVLEMNEFSEKTLNSIKIRQATEMMSRMDEEKKEKYLSEIEKVAESFRDVAMPIFAEKKVFEKAEGILPNFTLTGLTGGDISSDFLKNKVVLINFWATWCAPCKDEMPQLEKAYLELKNNPDVVFLIVNYGVSDSIEASLELIHELGFELPFYYDEEASLLPKLTGIQENPIPQNYLFDKEGKLRYSSEGYARGQRLEKELLEYIQELLDA